MGQSASERRLVENQVFFRQPNKKVAEGFTDLKEMAKAEGATEWIPHADQLIGFYCECSDETCRKRIRLQPAQYLELHKNSCQFVLAPGHHVPEVERIVDTSDNYIVVEKYEKPPEKVDKLNPTHPDHT